MLPIAGQTLLEYQVRLARACGGNHIVVLVEQLPAVMLSVFDRLRADGIDVDIAREPRDAADRIHPEEHVLLFAPGFVGSRRLLESLIARATPTLVTVPDQPAYGMFERVDATDRWSGLALLSGQLVRQTAAMIGDWSISSTLMRSALQSEAVRWRLEQPEDVTIVTDAAQAQAISTRLVRDFENCDQSPFVDIVAQPIANMLVPYLLAWAVPVELVALIPLIFAGMALFSAIIGWFTIGFLIFCFAVVIDRVSDAIMKISVRAEGGVDLFKYAKSIVLYIMLIFLGWSLSRSAGDWVSLLLVGWASSILILRAAAIERAPKWYSSVESAGVIVTLALLFGMPIAGLVAVVSHALAGQIVDRFFRR